jgi:hypothetical protein
MGQPMDSTKTKRIIMNTKIKERLEYLRGEIVAERISYGEIMELQRIKAHIAPDDVLLLQWAGVPEKHNHAAAVALGSIKSPAKAISSKRNGSKPARPGSNPRGRPKKIVCDSPLQISANQQ